MKGKCATQLKERKMGKEKKRKSKSKKKKKTQMTDALWLWGKKVIKV